jgi:pSer/pThr/pTyr-binding forkhead associated (FHA) protein
MLELEVFVGDQSQGKQVFGGQQLPVRIGRSSESEVRIDNPLVSRRHAVIDQVGNKLVIADQDSDNGLTVNGESGMRVAVLEDGDSIEIGKVRIRVGVAVIKQLDDSERRFQPMGSENLEATFKMQRGGGRGPEDDSPGWQLALTRPSFRSMPLPAGLTWIGAADECDVVVRGMGIAPRQLLLHLDGQTLRATDLTGKKKVKVNGNAITEVELASGDTVQVGSATFSIDRK